MKAETLYNLFSANLSNIKKELKVEFSQDSERIEDIYICPLTFRIYTREGLQISFKDHLSKEDVPPKSLGGKPLTLTSNIENNKAGHTLDVALQKYLTDIDFIKGTGLKETKFRVNNELQIKGYLENGKHPILHFTPKEMHQGATKLLNLLKTGSKFNLQFNFKKSILPEVSLLRIAYLMAFSYIGYGFFFGGTKYVNPNIQRIREQILNPTRKQIDYIPILMENFDDEFLGVNIIYEPKELRSLLVVFDLKTGHSEYRIGVSLPGPDDHGFDAYLKFKEIKLVNAPIELKVYTFPRKLNLNQLGDSKEYWKCWEVVNGWTIS